jgi:hypothetical protein
MFVLNIAHDLFENIFERDEAQYCATFIANKGHRAGARSIRTATIPC